MSETRSQLQNTTSRLPQICAGAGIGIAVLALAGWLTGVRLLAGQGATYIPMAPSTALAILLLGGALFCFARWPAQRPSRLFVLAAVSLVSLLGVLVLGQFLTGLDLGVEQVLSRTNELLGSTPLGRMSPLTAIAFLLEGTAFYILLFAKRWGHALTAAALLALSAMSINLVVLTGYAYGAPLLYGGPIIPVSLPTAIVFVLVGGGQIALAAPSMPARRAWGSATVRGRLVRAFLPPFLVLLLLEGGLEARLAPVSSINSVLWHSLSALVGSILMVAVTGWTAKRIGDAIEQAQAQIRSLARLADENPNPVLRLARDGRLLYANRSSQRLLEYWRCPQVGQSLPEAERRLIAETLERGVSQHEEVTCGEITCWLVLTPIPEMDYVTIYGRDVTERKRAEAALREREQRLTSIYDTVGDVIFQLAVEKDGRYRFASVNRAFLATTGLTSVQVVGKRVDEVIPEPSLSMVLGKYAAAIREKGIVRWEETSEYPTGRLTGEVSIAPVFDEAGNCASLVGAVHDITERKRAEEALGAERRLLRTLMDNIPDTIYFKDAESRFVRNSQAHARKFGLSDPMQMIGKTDFDFFTEEHARAAYEDEQAIVRSDQPLVGKEEKETWPDGRVTWVSTTKMPLHDQAGRIVGTFGISRDITERKRAEEHLAKAAQDLARSNTDLERFAYVASHDLQEPLRMVASFVQLLGERYRGQLDADADEFIGFAVDGAQRMQLLINDLLEYSRVGTHDEPFRATDVNSALDDALWNLDLAITDAGATVTHDPLPTVLADPTQLTRLFQNLIGNAIKFRGDASPVVHIAAQLQIADCGLQIDASIPQSAIHDPKSEWVFSVRDNGIGMDPKDHARIFGIFQRLHSRDDYPGTGIGLAVCQRIVERHGGRIWVESQLGQGTTFYFTLPVAA